FMKKRERRWAWFFVGVLLWWGLTGLTYAGMPPAKLRETQDTPATPSETPQIEAAFEAAIAAADLAQSATTADDWSQVTTDWAVAIQALQAVPTDSPQWVFAQRKAREYLANQAIAQQQAEEAGSPAVFPTLGSKVLDEQLGVYLSYIATFGPPDVMVIGSSRALQGINPQILQQRLARQGLESVRVYTFAVNGATAQVMSFLLRRLLTPEQMPKMVIWAGGSRSFNSARVDRTFASILESPGYAALQAGDLPTMDWGDEEETEDSAKADPIPVTTINGYGFLAVEDVFDPETYYQIFPRVAGRYDSSYRAFDLEGVQTSSLRAIASFASTNEIPLIFVNLPLSSDYLDETRLTYEQQFQQYLRREADRGNFTVVDLLQQWPTQNHFFADPSHLNQIGAAQIAIQLTENTTIPWQALSPSAVETAEDEDE
ncbi:MAG: hypothetical protein F6K42_28020, partial [Leptolyngbya sp. SIO1D8]|nr:hypothetical protein [Leptolyngbya sp. SIO1D8]